MGQRIAAAMIMTATCAAYACDRTEPVTPDVQPTPPSPPATATAAEPAPLQEDPGAENGAPITRAVAVLRPTQNSKVHGTITFSARKESDTLEVKADIRGLPPGAHAYHVHQFGDCSSDDGKAAGTHFNFAGSSENPGEKIDRITGNLGELAAGKDGKASATANIARATLQGKYSILGRSVVVHEKGNDPKSPPMGAAGGRIACGVIGVADADAVAAAAPAGAVGSEVDRRASADRR
jgi:superoxide dismutase, Cu-Zn family